MVKKTVCIRDIKDVQEFNSICSRFREDVDLAQGRYNVDAKSIMGIFSLNLAEKIDLIVYTEDEQKVTEAFAGFLAK